MEVTDENLLGLRSPQRPLSGSAGSASHSNRDLKQLASTDRSAYSTDSRWTTSLTISFGLLDSTAEKSNPGSLTYCDQHQDNVISFPK